MKKWMKLVGAALGLAAISIGSAIAQAYPSKPIQIVLGFPPGGSTDILARLVAQELQTKWGQPVIVMNKPGASTIIATDYVAKSAPDGYTLVVGASSAQTINPVLYSKLPYHPTRDLTPITIMGSFPLVLGVHPSVPANSVKQLIDHAKASPNALNYSSASTLFQLSAEMFKQMASINVTHVPYKGSMQALTGLTSGDVQMLFLDPAPVITQMKAGKVKALAVTSPKRWSLLPDVPTMAESGLPHYNVTGWVGLFAPAGTPQEITRKLQTEVARIVGLPHIQERLEAMGIDPGGRALGIDPSENTSEQLAKVIQDEAVRYAKVIKAANMKAD